MWMILALMPRSLKAFFISWTPGYQLAPITSVEDVQNRARPNFLLCLVSSSLGLWERKLYLIYGRPMWSVLFQNTKTLFSERLPPYCFDIYCHETLRTHHPLPSLETHKLLFRPIPIQLKRNKSIEDAILTLLPVSYTHLTLPTNAEV